MSDALEVWRGDEHVAQVIRHRGNLDLRYDDDYDGHPLSLSLPVEGPPRTRYAVRSYLQGLLPDNPNVLQAWASRFNVSENSEFDLISNVGHDAAGAFSFLPDGEEPAEGGAESISEEEIAERIRTLRLDATRWLPRGNAGQFSLAGAQAKFALFQSEDGQWFETTGMQPSTHILKPNTHRDFLTMAEIEDASMDVARQLNLPTADAELTTFADSLALVVSRYDRFRQPDGTVSRVHQEDFCQALGEPPQKKYGTNGGPSAADLLRIVASHSITADSDISTFVRALALNVCLRGTDAHAKNYSLLHTDGAVRLAPLYDVISFLPMAEGRDLAHLGSPLSIGSENRYAKIGEKHWVKLADQAEVDAGGVLDDVSYVLERVEDALSSSVRARTAGASATIDPATASLWTRRVRNACARMRGRM